MVYKVSYDKSYSTSVVHAFEGVGTDRTIVVDANAYLRTFQQGFGDWDAMLLHPGGAWTVTVNGILDSESAYGLHLEETGAITSKVKVGATGGIFGGVNAIFSEHALNLTNAGVISAARLASFGTAVRVDANASYAIMNSGEINGASPAVIGIAIDLTGTGTHTIVNSGTLWGAIAVRADFAAAGIEKLTNSGDVTGIVDLGPGNDVLKNTGTMTNVSMGDGNDTVVFSKAGKATGSVSLDDGNDKFIGGGAADHVIDGLGKDTHVLGGGNDRYEVLFYSAANDAMDTVKGGAGIDTYDVSTLGSGVIVNLDGASHLGYAANTAQLLATQKDLLTGFENVVGTSGDDLLIGSSAANELDGGDGADTLMGFGGNDVLRGGANAIGVEIINGGRGKDDLFGGTGVDWFTFKSVKDSGTTVATRDVVEDFEGAGAAGGDVIDLAAIDADSTNGALINDDFNYIGLYGVFSKTPGELRTVFIGAQTVIEGDVDGDAKADFSIALVGRLTLTQGDDFFL